MPELELRGFIDITHLETRPAFFSWFFLSLYGYSKCFLFLSLETILSPFLDSGKLQPSFSFFGGYIYRLHFQDSSPASCGYVSIQQNTHLELAHSLSLISVFHDTCV